MIYNYYNNYLESEVSAMAEHFKLVINPQGTYIVSFSGVEEDFADMYQRVLSYGSEHKAPKYDYDEEEEDSDNVPYDFTQFQESDFDDYEEDISSDSHSSPSFKMSEEQLNKLRKKREQKKKKLLKAMKEPESIDGKYALYNYKKQIKTRARVFSSYAFINFTRMKSQFVTLTFDPRKVEHADDLEVAHGCFRKFIKRVQSKFSDFKYIAVFSRQKTSRQWHYHCFMNFDETVLSKEIECMWGYGMVHSTVMTGRDEIQTRVSYCLSNMYEVNYTDLRGEKGYLNSQGLKKQIILRSWNIKEYKRAYLLMEKMVNSDLEKPIVSGSSVLEYKNGWVKEELEDGSFNWKQELVPDKTITYMYSKMGFPELFPEPLVAVRKKEGRITKSNIYPIPKSSIDSNNKSRNRKTKQQPPAPIKAKWSDSGHLILPKNNASLDFLSS